MIYDFVTILDTAGMCECTLQKSSYLGFQIQGTFIFMILCYFARNYPYYGALDRYDKTTDNLFSLIAGSSPDSRFNLAIIQKSMNGLK